MQPADIEQRIPIRAVAGKARHVDRQDQTNLFEPNTSDQLLEAAALSRRCSTDAEISVDDVDASFGPAELDGALAKRVLQSQTLLLGWSPPDGSSTAGCTRPSVAPDVSA